jgi:hypothetical protein
MNFFTGVIYCFSAFFLLQFTYISVSAHHTNTSIYCVLPYKTYFNLCVVLAHSDGMGFRKTNLMTIKLKIRLIKKLHVSCT